MNKILDVHPETVCTRSSIYSLLWRRWRWRRWRWWLLLSLWIWKLRVNDIAKLFVVFIVHYVCHPVLQRQRHRFRGSEKEKQRERMQRKTLWADDWIPIIKCLCAASRWAKLWWSIFKATGTQSFQLRLALYADMYYILYIFLCQAMQRSLFCRPRINVYKHEHLGDASPLLKNKYSWAEGESSVERLKLSCSHFLPFLSFFLFILRHCRCQRTLFFCSYIRVHKYILHLLHALIKNNNDSCSWYVFQNWLILYFYKFNQFIFWRRQRRRRWRRWSMKMSATPEHNPLFNNWMYDVRCVHRPSIVAHRCYHAYSLIIFIKKQQEPDP